MDVSFIALLKHIKFQVENPLLYVQTFISVDISFEEQKIVVARTGVENKRHNK